MCVFFVLAEGVEEREGWRERDGDGEWRAGLLGNPIPIGKIVPVSITLNAA